MKLPGCTEFGFCNKPMECNCRRGWTGNYCNIPICAAGCNETTGFCDYPNDCWCRVGWKGPNCDQCESYPGCQGYCDRPWECLCEPGFTGKLCDVSLYKEHNKRAKVLPKRDESESLKNNESPTSLPPPDTTVIVNLLEDNAAANELVGAADELELGEPEDTTRRETETETPFTRNLDVEELLRQNIEDAASKITFPEEEDLVSLTRAPPDALPLDISRRMKRRRRKPKAKIPAYQSSFSEY